MKKVVFDIICTGCLTQNKRHSCVETKAKDQISINQSINRSINRSLDRTINNQSIDQSINHRLVPSYSINQSINQAHVSEFLQFPSNPLLEQEQVWFDDMFLRCPTITPRTPKVKTFEWSQNFWESQLSFFFSDEPHRRLTIQAMPQTRNWSQLRQECVKSSLCGSTQALHRGCSICCSSAIEKQQVLRTEKKNNENQYTEKRINPSINRASPATMTVQSIKQSIGFHFE